MVTVGKLGRGVRTGVGRWFFDREKILRALDRKKIKALSKAGAFVRQRMRTSIKTARRKRISELTPHERMIFEIARRKAKERGDKPPRPWQRVHSKPGEPPRSITGLLRKHIYFVYDPQSESVVVGPAALNKSSGNVPEILEYGGWTRTRSGERVWIEPRPFARPALKAEKSRIRELFRDVLK